MPLDLGGVKVLALHEGHCGKESYNIGQLFPTASISQKKRKRTRQNDRRETKLVQADSCEGGWPSRSDGNPLEGPEPQIHGWSKENTTPGNDTTECTMRRVSRSFNG